MRASLVLACLLAVLVFAVPAADASTYCVPPATGCQHGTSSLEDALNQSAGHKGTDVLRVQAADSSYDIDVPDPKGGVRKPPKKEKEPAVPSVDGPEISFFDNVKGWMQDWLPIIFM